MRTRTGAPRLNFTPHAPQTPPYPPTPTPSRTRTRTL
jgi:hypothetical protein